MLAVVDALACLWIGEGSRAPAKHGPRFQDAHPRAASGQSDGGAQTCHARTDDDDIRRRHLNAAMTFNHVNAAMTACRGRPTRTRWRNTSYPVRSIERSSSK